MEVPGTCAICGKQAIVRTCSLCGAQACLEHYDPASGLDVRCARAGRPTGQKTPSDQEAANLPPLPEDAGGRYT